jgi:hypothetical protein
VKFSLRSIFVRAHPRIPLAVAALLFCAALAAVLMRLRHVDTLGYPPVIETPLMQDRAGQTDEDPFSLARRSIPDPVRNPFYSPFWKEWSEARKSAGLDEEVPPVENVEQAIAPIQENEPAVSLEPSPDQTIPMVYRGMIRRPDGTPLAMVEFPDAPSHLLLTVGDQCHEYLLVRISPDHLEFALDTDRLSVVRGLLVNFPVPAPVPAPVPSPEPDSPDVPDPAPEGEP